MQPPLGRVSHYRLVRALGQGGMGIVYEAVDENSGRTVVVKTILDRAPSPDAVRRFEREGRAAAAVSHPSVVRALDAGVAAGTPYLVFEHVAGGGLDARLKRLGPLDWREAARLGAAIARGLAAIHAAGIVHRDLKPANVLLTPEGAPRIADLGLAHADAASGLTRGGLTRSGQLLGTLEYVAPEQAEGSRTIDGRADLYSLGATLHALVAGRPPFEGTGITLVKQHLMDAPPALRSLVPGCDPALEALVLRLLAKDPAQRPSTADEVAQALDAIVAGTAPAPARSWRGLVVALALTGLTLVGVALGARHAMLRDLERGSPLSGRQTTTPTAREPLSIAWTRELGRPVNDLAVLGDGSRLAVAFGGAREPDERLALLGSDGARLRGTLDLPRPAIVELVPWREELFAANVDGFVDRLRVDGLYVSRPAPAQLGPDSQQGEGQNRAIDLITVGGDPIAVAASARGKLRYFRPGETSHRAPAFGDEHDLVAIRWLEYDTEAFVVQTASGRLLATAFGGLNVAVDPDLYPADGARVTAFEVTPDRRTIYVALARTGVRRLDVDHTEGTLRLRERAGFTGAAVTGSVVALALSAAYGASVSDAGELCVWDLDTGEALARRTAPRSCKALAAGPDGRWLVMATTAGKVVRFDLTLDRAR